MMDAEKSNLDYPKGNELKEYINVLNSYNQQQKKDDLLNKLKEAELEGSEEKINQLLQELQQIKNS